MDKLLLIGGGGHCKSVIDVVEQQNLYQIVGIIDKIELVGQKLLGYEIIDCDENLLRYLGLRNAHISVGHIKSNKARVNLFHYLKKLEFILPTIVSPTAYVSKHARIEEGTVVMHGALVNADAKIGKNCIINTNALIEHDAIIEDHCHISTAAVINGGVVVKENTFFGSNATTKEYIEVEGFIKAGSLSK